MARSERSGAQRAARAGAGAGRQHQRKPARRRRAVLLARPRARAATSGAARRPRAPDRLGEPLGRQVALLGHVDDHAQQPPAPERHHQHAAHAHARVAPRPAGSRTARAGRGQGSAARPWRSRPKLRGRTGRRLDPSDTVRALKAMCAWRSTSKRGPARGLDGASARRGSSCSRSSRADGFELDELREAAAQDRLPCCPVERVLGGEGQAPPRDEVAEETGPGRPSSSTRLSRALGHAASPRPDEARYTEADVERAQASRRITRRGPPERGRPRDQPRDEPARCRTLAATVVRAFGEAFLQRRRQRARPRAALTRRPCDISDPSPLPLLEPRARTSAARAAAPGGGRARPSSRRAPARVASTSRSASPTSSASPGSARARPGGARRRGRRLRASWSTDAAEPPVRLVKTIGDAAMLVSPEPDAVLVETALGARRGGRNEGEDSPAARGRGRAARRCRGPATGTGAR